RGADARAVGRGRPVDAARARPADRGPGRRRELRSAAVSHPASLELGAAGGIHLRPARTPRGLVPHPAIHTGFWPAITQRAEASSVAPIASTIGAPWVL